MMMWAGIILIVLGVVWFGVFFLRHRRVAEQAKAAAGWPWVEGEIVWSSVEKEQRRHTDQDSTPWYTPALRYTYSVGGRAYEGTRLRVGPVGSSHLDIVQKWISAYPIGARPAVRYDPADPGESVLELGRPMVTYLVASLLGLVAVGLGIYALTLAAI